MFFLITHILSLELMGAGHNLCSFYCIQTKNSGTSPHQNGVRETHVGHYLFLKLVQCL